MIKLHFQYIHIGKKFNKVIIKIYIFFLKINFNQTKYKWLS